MINELLSKTWRLCCNIFALFDTSGTMPQRISSFEFLKVLSAGFLFEGNAH